MKTFPIVAMMSVAAFAALNLASQDASAADDWVPDSHQASVGGDIYLFSARRVGSSLPIIPFLHLDVAEDVMLDVQLPLGMYIDGVDIAGHHSGTRFSLGNPTAGVRYAPTADNIRWWVGGGLSLPFGANDDDAVQIANGAATVALGLYDSYLYAADAIPVYATGGIDVRLHELFSLQASMEPILLIPIDDRRDSELFLQTSIGGEFRHDSGFGAGMDFKLAWLATENRDNAQALLDPYVGYTADTFFARLGLLLALDEPLGFGFDRGKVTTVHATVGGKL